MNEELLFFKWLDDRTLGCVTEKEIFKCSAEGTDRVKLVDKHPQLANFQIVNFAADTTHTWNCICGLNLQVRFILLVVLTTL